MIARGLDAAARRWLILANGILVVFATLPVLEPLLRAAGWTAVAGRLFATYAWVCHQLPSRSYFIAGQPLAYCERDTAIYTAMAACGLLWPVLRRRVPRLPPALFASLCLPIVLDGFTQLAALRESTWELRTLTGALFGLACVWFGFPLLEKDARLLRLSIRCLRLARHRASAAGLATAPLAA